MDFSQIPSPCFVIDEQKLESNLSIIDSIQREAGIQIILAFKGFAMWNVFPIIRKYVSAATVSSLNEAKLCNDEFGSKSHAYCVAYDPKDFDEIASLSSHLTFNSLGQYETFGAIARSKGISCGLRVNPEYSDVTTDLYNPSSPQSRLGVTSTVLGNQLPEGIEGLHVHVLCESNSYALEKLLESIELKFGQLLSDIRWINLGGGHLVTDKNYDTEHMVSVLKSFKEKHSLDLILEPGSAFAWQTGVLRTKILDIVDNGNVKTAIIDASFTCHMPDCLEMPYRPVITSAYQDKDQGAFKYRIGGVSCLAGDYLDEYSFDNALNIGDDLIFEDMIHYTMVKTNMFNGVHHPDYGIWKKDGRFEKIKSFGYQDYKNRLS